MWWSYALTSVGLLGLYLVGKHYKVGFMIAIGAQALWVIYALATNQYGFIVSAVAYAFVNYLGIRNFNNRKSEPEFTEADRRFAYSQGLLDAMQTVNRYGQVEGIERLIKAHDTEVAFVKGHLAAQRTALGLGKFEE
jgi:membrane protein implicated in regulation of membrane protease activity